MGPACDLGAHQGILRVKDIGINLLQCIPSGIIVSISGGSLKMAFTDTVFLHGMDHL